MRGYRDQLYIKIVTLGFEVVHALKFSAEIGEVSEIIGFRLLEYE
jgi:hypothetical protein